MKDCPERGRCGAMCACESEGGPPARLVITRQAYEVILAFEIGSRSRYDSRPIWPGGASGVTIGIGYDLGYHSPEQVRSDWANLPPAVVELLAQVAGVVGEPALGCAQTLREQPISVQLEQAERVFCATLKGHARKTAEAFPGAASLPPLAQGMLLSLVYNRGGRIDDTDRRREMRAIRDLVPRGDLEAIATEVKRMVRLWPDSRGLRRRRRQEAALISGAAQIAL